MAAARPGGRVPVRFGLVILLVLALAASAGCSLDRGDASAAPPIKTPLPDVAAEAWSARGHVTERSQFDPPLADPDLVIGAAWRAVYNSVSGLDGQIRRVSGAFFVPRQDPPQGGWPVISLAHGTTGIDTGCGPSAHTDLMGYLPEVRGLLADGYAVALTDYEGLGSAGAHPYLEPRTAAFNVIDAVRALHELTANVSQRWVAVGTSQGGQAVWAANELNSFYGDGTELLGSVAMSPAANITGLADLAWSGQLTDDQQTYFPLVIVGMQRYNAGLDEHRYLHGRIADGMGVLAECRSPVSDLLSKANAEKELQPDDRRDVSTLREALQKIALPQYPVTVPMLVVSGGRDRTVRPQWVSAAVKQSCQLGGHIEHVEIADAGHAELPPDAEKDVRQWITDRFDGVVARSDCATTS
jgi:alpha-beta hydrolase superfamily lysophospholipase